MKNFIKWIMAVTVLTVAFVAGTPAIRASAQDDYVSYQTFYDDLSPYGQWVYDPEYGDVWVPDVSSDFRPYYSRGRWAMTEYGNMWVSDYPWGWAAFHYGRWTYDPYYGWVWIPGNEWGPAWVSWRGNDNYYGWAPMGPGVTISMAFGNYYCPDNWWVFVGPQYLYRNDFYRHWRGPGYNSTIIHSTNFFNNHYHNRYVYGPRADDIQRVTHQHVNVYSVSNGGRPGAARVSGNKVSIYRPEVRTNTGNVRPAPANLLRAPREVNKTLQPVVTNGRPEFRTAVQNHQVQRVNAAPDNRQVTPAIRPQNTNRQAPVQQNPRQLERSTPMPNGVQPTQQPQRTQPVQQQQPQRTQPVQQQPQRVQPAQQQQQQRFDNRQQVQPQRVQPAQQQPQQQRFDNRQQQPQRMQPQQQPQRQQPVQQPRMQQQQQPQRQQPVQQPRMQQQQQPRMQPAPQPQRQQPAIRQEPRQQATPAPRNEGERPGGRR